MISLKVLLPLVYYVSAFRLELMYISLIVNIRPSLTHTHGFKLLVPLPQFIEITCFIYTKRINLLNLKRSSESNLCKSVLGAAKLAYANKTKKSITSQKLGSLDFWRIAKTVLSIKVNLLYLLYVTAWRRFLLHLIKQYCSLKTFLRTLILMTQVPLYLFSILELISNCIIFL